jgi:hypothetical protein
MIYSLADMRKAFIEGYMAAVEDKELVDRKFPDPNAAWDRTLEQYGFVVQQTESPPLKRTDVGANPTEPTKIG